MSAGVGYTQKFEPAVLCFCRGRSQPGSMAKEKKVNSFQGRALCHFRHRALAVHKEKSQGRERAPWRPGKEDGGDFGTLEQ